MDSSISDVNSLRNFENPQQSNATKYRNSERRHNTRVKQDHLTDTADHHEAVEAVEERHEVALETQAIHLEEHLHCEQCDKEHVGVLCREQKGILRLFDSLMESPSHLETRRATSADRSVPSLGRPC